MENKEREERLKAAEELESIAIRLNSFKVQSRILSIVKTKIEEAALWYAKLLKEEDEQTNA